VAGTHRVDCRWPDHRLTVELDSYTYHHSRHAWEQDRRRERRPAPVADDLRRYTYGDVFDTPRLMLAELRAAADPVAREPLLELVIRPPRLLAQVCGDSRRSSPASSRWNAARKTIRCVHAACGRPPRAPGRPPAPRPPPPITGESVAASCSQPRNSRSRSALLWATSRGKRDDRVDRAALDDVEERHREVANGFTSGVPRGRARIASINAARRSSLPVQEEVLLCRK